MLALKEFTTLSKVKTELDIKRVIGNSAEIILNVSRKNYLK